MTVLELYKSTVRPLPPAERLRLASLILGELPVVGTPPLDYDGEWTDEDLADFSVASLRYADEVCPCDEVNGDG